MRPGHADFERALFTIEISSLLRVYLGSFVQIPAGMVIITSKLH